MIPLFPNDEYEARCRKARTLMAEQGIDALLVTHPTNHLYFTGYRTFAEFSFPRPTVLVLPVGRDPVVVAQDFHLAVTWEGDFREYPRVGRLPVEMVKSVFEETGCSRGRVGAELGREQHLAISHNDFLSLQAALPDAEFVDASGILWDLRMVKSEAEIATIAEACRIQDAIFDRVFRETKAGMTTREIELSFRRAILESGAEHNFSLVCIGDFDPRQAAGSSHPDRVLGKGDLLWVDLGLSVRGYQTDYCRAAVAGGPSARQREAWGKVQEVCQAGIGATRPGIPASELCKVQLAAAEARGLDMSTWPAGRYGHGGGLHTTEPPYLSPEDDTVLRPGMVIHIEPGCIRDDGIYVREEKVVVTDDGCRLLSKAPWELRHL